MTITQAFSAWAARVLAPFLVLSLGVALRVLANVVLSVLGVLALYLTLDSMFPDTVGLIELSGMELMFLALYSAAAKRIRHRLASHGSGVAASVLTLLKSAGWCALGLLLLLVVLLVIGQFDSASLSAPYPSDDLSENTWFQAVWLGTLLISAYLAAPRIGVAATNQGAQEADRLISEESRT